MRARSLGTIMSSSTPIQFLLDENVRIELAEFLTGRDINFKNAKKSSTDKTLAKISIAEERIVVTNDSDFSEMCRGDVFGDGRVNPDVNNAGEGGGQKIQEIPVPSQKNGILRLGRPENIQVLGPEGRTKYLMARLAKEIFRVAGDIFVKEKTHEGGLRLGKGDEFPVLELLRRKVKGGPNMIRSKLGEVFLGSNFRDGNLRFKKLQHLPDHNPGILKAWLTVANFGVYLYQLTVFSLHFIY